MQRALVFVVAGWSGFNVMALELLSGRVLAPNFGNSIYVWGGVITVFMLALAMGYLLGGRLSLNRPTLRRLGLLLLASAVATLPVVLVGDATLDAIFELVQDPRYGSLLSAAVLFAIPTLLCGTISPYAVRLLVHESRRSGHFAGLLFFVSTFGSAAGTILTSFYLVLVLELRQIIGGLLAISTVLAILTMLMARPDARAD